jgi:hypothetical protein
MRVNVAFKVKSFDHMDEVAHRLRSLAGKSPVATGFCLPTNERDLDYTFRNRSSGMAFMRRANKLRGVRAEAVG